LKKNIKTFTIFLVIAFLADQISKILIVNFLSPFNPPTEVLGSLLRFKLVYNPYGVFSISFGTEGLYYIFAIAGIILFTYIGLLQRNKLNMIIFSFIVGGAIGNVVDRLRLKYVIDFIDMGIGNLRWFTYNLADAFITIGAITLIVIEVFSIEKKKRDSVCL